MSKENEKTHGVSNPSEDHKSNCIPTQEIGDINGRCAYFQLADYYNIKLFSDLTGNNNDEALKREISNRFYLALLLYDNVIMHCSDPLRNQMICSLLENNIDYIKEGIILFVFSDSISNIKKDYKNYIEDRKNEYQRNDYSGEDIASLEQEHITEDYYNRVIELLENSKTLLKRGLTGNAHFLELIKEDLKDPETIVMHDGDFNNSQLRLLNLRLGQLLNIRYLDMGRVNSLFNKKEHIDPFIAKWKSLAEKEALIFSRHTFTEEVNGFIDVNNSRIKIYQKTIIQAIEVRLSLLYSTMNSSKHFIVEFRPYMEERSIHSWNNFNVYFKCVAGKPVTLDKNKVDEIRKHKERNSFINTFFACMASLQAKELTATGNELSGFKTSRSAIFNNILKCNNINSKFPEIKKVLNDD